jgi:hypothetical protein
MENLFTPASSVDFIYSHHAALCQAFKFRILSSIFWNQYSALCSCQSNEQKVGCAPAKLPTSVISSPHQLPSTTILPKRHRTSKRVICIDRESNPRLGATVPALALESSGEGCTKGRNLPRDMPPRKALGDLSKLATQRNNNTTQPAAGAKKRIDECIGRELVVC